MGSFRELSERVSAVHQEVRDTGRALFEAEVKALMERFPEIRVFSFYQYTPSFNDGDPCSNSLCGPFVALEGDERVCGTRLDEDESSDISDNEALSDAVYALGNEYMLESIFGTNTRVTVTRGPNGIEIKDDYHDCGY